MLVFISYPREFKKFAAKLEMELKDRKFEAFLDIEQIHAVDLKPWNVKIETNIKKASVFIILYDHKAAIEERYFRTELERIKKERRKNVKRIITVIFPPTKAEDLPPYLNRHQLIEVTTNGATSDRHDDYWINKVIDEIDSLNIKKEVIKKWLKALAIALAGAAMIALLHDHLFGGALAVCQSLKGDYDLHGTFVYIQDDDIKVTATNGYWKAHNCREKEGLVILNGDDESKLQIEILINNKHEHIADAVMKYISEITIGNDGLLVDRRYFPVADNAVTVEETEFNKQNLKSDSAIRKKRERSEQLINDKLLETTKKKQCIPTLGRNEADHHVIVLLCKNYIKVIREVEKGSEWSQ